MPGEPSPGLGTLLQSGAGPSNGSSTGSPRELRKSGSAGKRQEGLQQMNTRSRGERTVGIIAGIEKDLERRIGSGSPCCAWCLTQTHLCWDRCWKMQPRAGQ